MNEIKRKYEACVLCWTYNHGAYIVDALNGFSCQNTSFPYVCVIVDDASTDNEKEVIEDYLKKNFLTKEDECLKRETNNNYEMVLTRHKTNVNCFFAVFYLKYNHYQKNMFKERWNYVSEYRDRAHIIAYCEGDDYWISSDFLQASYDYLNANNDYSSVFGNKIVCNKDGVRIKTIKFKGGLDIHDIMRGYNMGLRNICFRKEVLDTPPVFPDYRDLLVYYKCAKCGKMKYIDTDFAVYRLTGGGVYSSLNENSKIRDKIYHYYELHKQANFKYQKDCIYYQMKVLWSYLSKPSLFKFCIEKISEKHMPRHDRFIYYMTYSVIIVGSRILNKIS